jgi:hypothetical protein
VRWFVISRSSPKTIPVTVYHEVDDEFAPLADVLIYRDEDRSGCGHRARVDVLGQAGLTSRP